MKCSIKQQQTTSGYNSIPDAIAADDETAAVPFGTTLLPTSTTTNRSSKWNMVAIVAFMMMLLLAVAGGTVLRRNGEIAAAEGLVVATQVHTAVVPSATNGEGLCLPAGGTFGGVSHTTSDSESYAFETCFQFGNHHTYCWTKSYYQGSFLPCGPIGDAWKSINADYVITPGVDPKTNPKRCGTPCQGQQHEN